MSLLSISASWLNEHEYCEYKFYRRHVLKEDIPRTRAMVIGENIHSVKEEKFLESAVPTTMEEFLTSTRYTITKELMLEHEFDDFLLKGKIDELGIDANNIYVIDDKPRARPYKGILRQLWAYCLLFRKNYSKTKKDIFAVLRDRDTDIEVWSKEFSSDDSVEVMKTLFRIRALFSGKGYPIPTSQPERCKACILHKLNRCKYSLA